MPDDATFPSSSGDAAPVARTRVFVVPACLLAGAAVAFAMPPWGWWPFAFLGLAAFDRLLAGRGPGSRFRRGTLFGAGWLFPATFWMIDLTPPGYLVTCVLFSLLFGAGAAAIPGGDRRWIGLPAALVMVEAIRWRFPFGGVPLATLPMSQISSPLAPTVRIAGPLLLSGLVAVAGVGVSAGLTRNTRAAVLAAALVVAGTLAASISPTGNAVDTIDVAVVQGGGPQNTLAENTDFREVIDRHIEASRLVRTPVDLVLWPEDVVHVPGPIETTGVYEELQMLAAQFDAVFIPGIFERASTTTNKNASIALLPDGTQVDRYDKVRIVPFGEYVPLRWAVEPFAPSYLPQREVERGTGPAILRVPLAGRDVALGVSISWEIFFEDRTRDAIDNGAEILLNPTNGSSYWLTIVQTQQVASSRLRALETGRWVLQAAPTGFSAIIDPDGKVIQRTGISEQRVLHATVELRTGKTLATRLGVWPMILVAIVALAASHWGRFRPRPSP